MQMTLVIQKNIKAYIKSLATHIANMVNHITDQTKEQCETVTTRNGKVKHHREEHEQNLLKQGKMKKK